MTNLKLIVGLGNPGARYEQTRHNVGFKVLDYYQAHTDWSDWQDSVKFKCLLAKNARAILVKPQTFMNDSGQAVQKISQYFKVPPNDIMVIHDDVDLAGGLIRTRTGQQGSGGHKGVESIISYLGSDFYRLRYGIGKSKRLETDRYVLGKLTWLERNRLNKAMPQLAVLIDQFLAGQTSDQTVSIK